MIRMMDEAGFIDPAKEDERRVNYGSCAECWQWIVMKYVVGLQSIWPLFYCKLWCQGFN